MKIGIKYLVEVAHRNDIGIMLAPYVESGNYVGCMEPKWPLIEPEVWDSVVMTWAEFAQENDIEIFAPGVEMSLVIKEDKVGKWFKDILPKIREVYDGEVATDEHFDIDQWKILDRAGSFKGYDYIGMTVFPRKTYPDNPEGDIRSLADYRDYVENEAKVMKRLAKKYGIKKLLAAPIGMDFWKSTVTFEEGKIPIEIRAKAYSQALDMLKEHGFDAVFLHDNLVSNSGEELEVEMSNMIKDRWAK